MSITQIHAFPLMVALNRPLSEWVTAKPGMAWEAALAAEYLRNLERAMHNSAVGVTDIAPQPSCPVASAKVSDYSAFASAC